MSASPSTGTVARPNDDLKASMGETIVRQWTATDGERPALTGQELMALGAYGIPTRRPADPIRAVKILAGAGIPDELIEKATGTNVYDWPYMNPFISQALDLHVAGLTPLAISEEVPMSRPWVHLQLNRRGLTPNSVKARELSNRSRQNIRRAHAAGEPIASIARRMNVTVDQVRYTVGR